MLLSYEEKQYLVKLLRKERSLFRKTPDINKRLLEKLEQMVRNEQVNAKELNRRF